jgi:penicillin-binding protein 2
MNRRDDVQFEEALCHGAWAPRDRATPLPRGAFVLLAGVFAVVLCGIAARLFAFGIAHDAYAARAAMNADTETVIPAYRGIITDRFGEALVKNIPSFQVSLDINAFMKLSSTAQAALYRDASRILRAEESEFRALVARADIAREARVSLSRAVSPEEAIAIRGLGSPALIVEDDYRREYKDPFVFAHVIGYTGVASTGRAIEGRAGVEASYDALLRGIDGIRVSYRNARGTVLLEKQVSEAKSGKALALTIDADFMRYMHARFARGLASLGKTSGVAIAMNPQNGEILGLISFPSFNNNQPAAYLSHAGRPLFNRAISGIYSPGSTIKPLVALAALREKIVTPAFTVYSPGYLELPNPYHPDAPSRFLDWHPQGVVNVVSALARSSNVYFYIVGGGCTQAACSEFGRNRGLGIQKLNEYWRLFGFDQKTGIDLPAEAVGFLPNPEEKEKRTGAPWRIGDTYNVSIGQGDFGVTPLRLLAFISSIANGGRVLAPYVASAGARPQALFDYSAWADELAIVRQGMRDVVARPYGTANLMYDLDYKTSGKTGSAQIANNAKTNAFFVGFGPTDNPQIALLILVEDAKAGSLNAVPIAKDIFAWYYAHRM